MSERDVMGLKIRKNKNRFYTKIYKFSVVYFFFAVDCEAREEDFS